jgi:hypothetical protein
VLIVEPRHAGFGERARRRERLARGERGERHWQFEVVRAVALAEGEIGEPRRRRRLNHRPQFERGDEVGDRIAGARAHRFLLAAIEAVVVCDVASAPDHDAEFARHLPGGIEHAVEEGRPANAEQRRLIGRKAQSQLPAELAESGQKFIHFARFILWPGGR